MADWFTENAPKSGQPAAGGDWFAQNAPGAAKHSVGGFLSNLVDSGKNLVTDAAGAMAHPLRTLGAIGSIPVGLAEKAGIPVGTVKPGEMSSAQMLDSMIEHFKGRYGSFDKAKEALYKDPVGVVADVSTLFGGAGAAADAAKLGKVAKIAGTVSEFTDPLRLAGKAAVGTAKLVGKGADATATSLTRGALRGGFNVNEDAGKVASAVQTAQEVAPAFSQKGLDKITTALGDVRKQIAARVQAGDQQGLTIDPQRVQLRIDETRAKFGNQVNPDADLRDIDKVADTFARNNPGPIPVGQAQAMKVGSNSLNQTKYGKVSTAQVEAEKAATRGVKEELENAMPELGSLNPNQAKLMNLEDVMGKAVTKYVNSGGFMNSMKKGLGSNTSKVIAGLSGAGAVAGHSPAIAATGAAANLMMAVLSDPAVKMRLANAINTARRMDPARYGTPGINAAMSTVADYAARLATPASRVTAAQQ